MKKIFKCDLIHENGKWYTECPSGQVIRTDYVDDGYDKGWFVWIIIDTANAENKEKREIKWVDTKTCDDFDDCDESQLGVLEKQYIYIRENQEIEGVADYNGKFWLFCRDTTYYNGCFSDKEIEIRGYKTGQEIDVSEEELTYLGVCRIFILKELAVYFFARNYKS